MHVDDVVEAFLLVLTQFAKAKNQVFNLASGKGISLLEVATIVKSKLNGSNDIQTEGSSPGDVVQSISDISKIKDLLGFSPKIEFDTGIQNEIEEHSS